MSVWDVTGVLEMAIEKGVNMVKLRSHSGLLSDNGPCYLSSVLKKLLKSKEMDHRRGAPSHPQTQGKIVRYLRTMKNVVKRDNYYFPGELELAVGMFPDYYNNERYHEALDNVTPSNMYQGRRSLILGKSEVIKRKIIQRREYLNLKRSRILLRTTP